VDETVASLGRAGVKATGGTVDVADLPALRRWVGEAAEALGGLDIFVANVSALAQGMDEDAWRKGFEIDVMGTVFGIEAALPFLEKSSAGSIVVVGSTAMAEVYGPTRSYAAVKATLIPYVKGLARNLADKNVRANVVSPGNVYFKGGTSSSSATPRCSPRCWRATRPAGWERRKRSPTPSCSWPARAPAS
jgi:NAD(P)-dependent dehydrogenase (short-subunit alcohol dehydrogenase family)